MKTDDKTLSDSSQITESSALLEQISFLCSGRAELLSCRSTKLLPPFAPQMLEFLSALSQKLMTDAEAQTYTEVVALGFYLRHNHLLQLKAQFYHPDEQQLCVGRGVVLHIAPNNVPVNFAYSLLTGLLTGNVNIVRLPSPAYKQVEVILRCLKETLQAYPQFYQYIILIKTPHSQVINDYLSSLCDLRVVWGGDQTIATFRASPLAPRAMELNFANRYSIAIINSELYLNHPHPELFVHDFYNDTYLSDQNACTSPRLLVFTGQAIARCKQDFYLRLHTYLKEHYTLAPISAVNKLTSACLVAAKFEHCKLYFGADNLITRVKITALSEELLSNLDGAGFFFEYDCQDLTELSPLLNDPRFQTICYLEDKAKLLTLLANSGGRGVDRIVPIGQSLNFDLIWDGYQLLSYFTRTINLS